MVRMSSVRIAIYCNNREMYTGNMNVYTKLVQIGFTNLEVVTNSDKILDLYEYHKDGVPEIIIVDVDFISKNFNGFQVLADIKEELSDVVVICLNSKETIVEVLQSDCDSFIDKNSNSYLEDIDKTVRHWAKYIVERNSLEELYKSILG